MVQNRGIMAESGKNPSSEKGVKTQEAKQHKPAPPRETQIIRLAETNLDGNKAVREAIRRVDGISFMLSNAIVKQCGFAGKKLGQLSEAEMKRLEEAITNPQSLGIPVWMLNRRNEPLTGRTRHLTASQLEFTHKMDINELKKMKCYRGVRHIQGQPVRGQRTRSTFRKGKSVGVRRKKEAPAAAAAKK
jgi:small subunit ribosomal protein S13